MFGEIGFCPPPSPPHWMFMFRGLELFDGVGCYLVAMLFYPFLVIVLACERNGLRREVNVKESQGLRRVSIDIKEGEKRTRTITDVRYTMAKIIDN